MRFILRTLLISIIAVPLESFADVPFFYPEGQILADDSASLPGGCIPGPVSLPLGFYYRDDDIKLISNSDNISAEFVKLFYKSALLNYQSEFSRLKKKDERELKNILDRIKGETQVIVNATIFPQIQDMQHQSSSLNIGSLVTDRSYIWSGVRNGTLLQREKTLEGLKFLTADTNLKLPDCFSFYIKRRTPIECYMETYGFNIPERRRETRLVILHISLNRILDSSGVKANWNEFNPPIDVLGSPAQIAANMMWCINVWFQNFTPLTGNVEATQ